MSVGPKCVFSVRSNHTRMHTQTQTAHSQKFLFTTIENRIEEKLHCLFSQLKRNEDEEELH